MKQYKELLVEVLKNGVEKEDRTGTGTISVFGTQKRYDLSKGFPLLTTKKTAFRLIVLELLWFMRGETNMVTLLKDNVKIWNDDAYAQYRRFPLIHGHNILSKKQFLDRLLIDEEFADTWGALGPIYGQQWRSWTTTEGNPIDQLSDVIKSIKGNPDSRRHLVTAWNPEFIDDMALPPCHVLFQFYVADGRLSCQLYQRSADVFLGVPFNIASYALLTHLIAKECGLEVGDFVHTTGDTHLYKNHIVQADIQLRREERPLPILEINVDRENIWDYQLEDFELIGYDPHPAIKGEQSS